MLDTPDPASWPDHVASTYCVGRTDAVNALRTLYPNALGVVGLAWFSRFAEDYTAGGHKVLCGRVILNPWLNGRLAVLGDGLVEDLGPSDPDEHPGAWGKTIDGPWAEIGSFGAGSQAIRKHSPQVRMHRLTELGAVFQAYWADKHADGRERWRCSECSSFGPRKTKHAERCDYCQEQHELDAMMVPMRAIGTPPDPWRRKSWWEG